MAVYVRLIVRVLKAVYVLSKNWSGFSCKPNVCQIEKNRAVEVIDGVIKSVAGGALIVGVVITGFQKGWLPADWIPTDWSAAMSDQEYLDREIADILNDYPAPVTRSQAKACRKRVVQLVKFAMKQPDSRKLVNQIQHGSVKCGKLARERLAS